MELLLSIVVASATLIYTVVTIFQLVESRKNRFLKESPNIVPFLKTTEEHSVLQLIIKNFGEGIAKNVKISFSKDFNRFGKEKKLSDIGIAKYGMNYFPPQYELKFDIHWMNDICNSHQGDDIEIIITCENIHNHKFEEIFLLPFKQLFGQIYVTPPETYMGQIPYYLKEINSTLKKNKN
ncbi:MAG: hypothetical protein BWX62_00452 [Bacteroidetes bacterium ADurb.Bin037]|nr:MAG: hypothetical protein BWX62_00452 [Bacteroidetes bacterium ADurb.Bin037]HPW78449.1 hypothetical protein [Bacteroidales bacterium]HQB55923.1 hypothetical protein [Bacteroidales bacterium]